MTFLFCFQCLTCSVENKLQKLSRMPRLEDPVWHDNFDDVTDLKGKVVKKRCAYCRAEFVPNATRAKKHLVIDCPKAYEHVKHQFLNEVQGQCCAGKRKLSIASISAVTEKRRSQTNTNAGVNDTSNISDSDDDIDFDNHVDLLEHKPAVNSRNLNVSRPTSIASGDLAISTTTASTMTVNDKDQRHCFHHSR